MIQTRIRRCSCRSHGIIHRIVEIGGLTRRVWSLVVDGTTLRQDLAVGQDNRIHLDATGGHIRAGGVARGCNGEVDNVGRRGRRISSPEIHHSGNVVGRQKRKQN
jgi:hypothetical protein